MIVRWSLAELPVLLAELGVGSPFLVASPRVRGAIDLPLAGVWAEVPSDRIEVAPAADGLLAVGGGSAIDTAKAASAATGLPLVSVPTTYAGAEWAPSFGVRDAHRRLVGGGGGARLAGIVYEVSLTLGLPRAETVGTALNALAHCAEALYVDRHNADADREALAGAPLLDRWVTEVVARPSDLEARTKLLEGAMHAGAALGLSGLALGHAVAQALGGRYGLPHGAMNALSLPPALRFNEPAVPAEVARFGEALGTADPASRVEELAQLGGFERLRQCGVPEDDLPGLARDVVARPGTRANPRPVTVADAEGLLRSIW